ncbi:glycosyltransferase family 2 protein [Lacinutrix undariae]
MKVTIAIPFYNAEAYLLDAIRSVFAQTHKDWELILINDGSTDDSLKIAQSVKDPRVRVVSDGKNKRLAGRLNEVTKLAKYDYIARMDADDLMSPNRIEKQLAVFKENPEIDIITTGVFSTLNNLTLKGVRGQSYNEASFEDIISRRKAVTHAAIIAKKTWYERYQYDESLSIAQDLELWIRASYNNDFKIVSIAEPLYIYREEDNVTGHKLLRAYANERQMISKYSLGVLKYKLSIKSYFKSAFVRLLIIFNKVDILLARRANGEILETDNQKLENAIKQIHGVKLPL